MCWLSWRSCLPLSVMRNKNHFDSSNLSLCLKWEAGLNILPWTSRAAGYSFLPVSIKPLRYLIWPLGRGFTPSGELVHPAGGGDVATSRSRSQYSDDV